MRLPGTGFVCCLALTVACDRGAPRPGAGWSRVGPAAFAAELAPADDIVLVCHAGPMGDEIAAILAGQGFPDVRNLAGGMRDRRGPVEQGP